MPSSAKTEHGTRHLLDRLWSAVTIFKARHSLLIDSLLVFALYYLTARASLFVYFTFSTSPAVIWPPIGIGLAAVLLRGYMMATPIFLAHFLALLSGSPLPAMSAVGVAAGYGLEMIAAAYALRTLGFDYRMRTLMSPVYLIGVAIFCTMVAPLVSSVWQYLLGALPWDAIFVSFTRAWSGGIFSVLVVTPFILHWFPLRRFESRTSTIEKYCAFVALFLISYFLFWTLYAAEFGISVIFFIPAVLIWFALRFHPRWTSLALAGTAAFAFTGVILTPNQTAALNIELLNIEIYLAFVAGIFNVFAAVVEERRNAFNELERAYTEADAANRAKSEFIAILAHELRNPLAPIVSSLELLRTQPQTPEALFEIGSAEQHATMIRRLLDDLLDTARLSQKKFRLQKSKVLLRDLVEESVASTRGAMEARSHELTVHIPDSPVYLYVDSVRIKQIIINLLNNAAKYTPNGGAIELDIALLDDDICMKVKDNGIGIDTASRPTLFEPFKQVAHATRASTGLGIGLFLSQQLAEMHGGRIAVDSEGLGKGSIFSFFLPHATKDELAIMESKAEAPQKVAATTILIADDNIAAAEGLQKLLRLKGHVTDVAFSGGEALKKMATSDPSVAILDIGMPDMSGYEVAKMLRARGWKGTLIALTGYGQDSDKRLSEDAGFDFHLVKPVSIADIERLIARQGQ